MSLHVWCCTLVPLHSEPPKAAVIASTRCRVELPAIPSPQVFEQFLRRRQHENLNKIQKSTILIAVIITTVIVFEITTIIIPHL